VSCRRVVSQPAERPVVVKKASVEPERPAIAQEKPVLAKAMQKPVSAKKSAADPAQRHRKPGALLTSTLSA